MQTCANYFMNQKISSGRGFHGHTELSFRLLMRLVVFFFLLLLNTVADVLSMVVSYPLAIPWSRVWVRWPIRGWVQDLTTNKRFPNHWKCCALGKHRREVKELETLPRLLTFLKQKFHPQWCLLNIEDNNSHEPYLLTFLGFNRLSVAEMTYCPFKD